MILQFEVGVGALPILERVDVSHEVTANAECVDEFLNTRGLVDVICGVNSDVFSPVNRHVRDTQ